MNVIAINGSPRKNGNTATLLAHALKGDAFQGATTELIHLYAYDFKGCISCFSCKLKGGKSYGTCALNDALSPILQKVSNADAIILGSPIYLRSITSSMRAFLERLIYQYLVYDKDHSSLFQKKIPVGFIYTMNVTEDIYKSQYEPSLEAMHEYLKKTFGSVETLATYDTSQFQDYSKYVATAFDVNKKRIVQKEQFPLDCKNAYDMGVRFTNER